MVFEAGRLVLIFICNFVKNKFIIYLIDLNHKHIDKKLSNRPTFIGTGTGRGHL